MRKEIKFHDYYPSAVENNDYALVIDFAKKLAMQVKTNQDFTTVSKNLENGGRTIEYYITLDMAKELSMVERNEKGRQARL